MKKKQYLFVVGALAVTLFIYFAGNTTKPKKEDAGHTHLHSAPHVAPVNIDSFISAAKKKLPPNKQAEISGLENSITRGDLKSQKSGMYEAIGKIWLDQKNRVIGGYYMGLSGKLENSEKKLNFAAHLLSEELYKEQNSSLKQWLANEAIDYYSSSLALNPTNDTVRMDYAQVYIDGIGDVMKGVEQLLIIDRQDSTHIPVNIVLGKMAIESGQLDKAIERGYRVIRLDKNNLEAHLFLAEAYKRSENKEKAIEYFTKAKEIMNNPDFSRDVDQYIQSFK